VPRRSRVRAIIRSTLLQQPSRSGRMTKEAIHSDNAPAALGPYSQAIRAGSTVYLSGQIGIDPATGNLRDGVEAQTRQVLDNLQAVCAAAGGSLDDLVKLTLLLADMADFARVNEIMAARLKKPFPARATYQVAALPKAARIEVEGVLVLQSP
jgi:2-iminobutanoate/2-iminopropanoate deaminase